jgi:hypothetical protein
MTVANYIKTERLADRFPNMPIDFAAGKFWLCDNDWKRIDDPKNWFDSQDKARAFKTKMLDK